MACLGATDASRQLRASRTSCLVLILPCCVHHLLAGDHAPLIKLFGVPARYANAAYEAASKAGKLDAVEKDLKAFGDVINSNAEFATYLSNPTISRTSKVELIESIFDGKKTEPISKNLFATMAANARLADTGRVVEAFSELMKARRNEVSAADALLRLICEFTGLIPPGSWRCSRIEIHCSVMHVEDQLSHLYGAFWCS